MWLLTSTAEPSRPQELLLSEQKLDFETQLIMF